MMALNFPLIGAMAPAPSMLQPQKKADWRASLFDRLMPEGDLEDDDKEAAMRQGLLGLASGLLGTGGGFGNALSAGIQNGLLATNQSVDNQAERKYNKQLMEQRTALDGVVHSQRVGADGFIYNTMRDGSIVNTGVEADRQMWLRDHPGMAPELVGKSGAILPVGQPQPARQMPAPMPLPGAPSFAPTDGDQTSIIEQEIGRPLTMQERQQIAQGTFQLQAPTIAPAAARPSEAQTAAEIERARLGAQMQYEPAIAGMTTAAQEGARLDAMRSGMSVEAEREGMLTRAKTEAQAQGEFLANLPKVVRASDETVALLDKAINHPGRATATGMSSAIDPRNYMRGTDARNFQVLLDQLGGRAFLEAFESLKGGGQITEIEGRKATEAMARLNTAQSDEEFVSALKELREIAANAKTRALERADSYGAGPVAKPTAAPADDLDSLLEMYR